VLTTVIAFGACGAGQPTQLSRAPGYLAETIEPAASRSQLRVAATPVTGGNRNPMTDEETVQKLMNLRLGALAQAV